MSVVAVRIPDNLTANWRSWWGAHAEKAAADVHRRVGKAVEAWQLMNLEVLPGGEVALVLGARCPDGEVVLKLTPDFGERTAEFAAESEALILWAPTGAVPEVLGVRDQGLTTLLARVRPGRDLDELCSDAMETVIVLGELACALHRAREGTERFCHLSQGQLADDWRKELRGTREAAELEALLAPTAQDALLHLDMHSKNVLRNHQRWVAIDPWPHLGDPHAEVFGFLVGAPKRTVSSNRSRAGEQVRELVSAYANAAGLDYYRTAAWTRLRALAEGGWAQRENPEWAIELARIAEALDT